jgi:hypothetical protein
MNSIDKAIWKKLLLKNKNKNNEDLDSCDEDYKQQLIDGYKICKHKKYNFTTISDEELYFMRNDVTAEEEVYYYTFVVSCEWRK